MLAEITNSPRGANVAANSFTTPNKATATKPASTSKLSTLSRSSSAKKLAQKQSSSSHFKAGLQRETEIELVFAADGPLGFTFGGGGAEGEAEVITTTGQAVTAGLQRGDEIIAINGLSIEGIEHDEVADMLKQAQRPCKLTVQRVQSVNDIEEANIGKVVRQGHLSKFSTKGIWQGRTFHLNSRGELRYYSGSGSKARLGGLIELTECFGIEASDKKIRIKMDEKGDNTIALRAPSKSKAAAWVFDMEQVIEYIWSRNWSPAKGSRAEEQAKAREHEAIFMQRRHKLKMAGALANSGVPHIRTVISAESLLEAGSSLGSEMELAKLTPLFDGCDYATTSYADGSEDDVDTCRCSFPAHIMRARSASVDGILRRSLARTCPSPTRSYTPDVERYPTFSEEELIVYANTHPLWWQRLLGKCSALPKDTMAAEGRARTITGKETRNRRRSSGRIFSSANRKVTTEQSWRLSNERAESEFAC